MATHSSVLAWRIPGTGKPGGLPSMGLQRVGHNWSDLAAAAAAAFIKVMPHRGKQNFDSCIKDIESQKLCLNIYWNFLKIHAELQVSNVNVFGHQLEET